MMVRRDKRLKLNGNNLVISQLEVAIISLNDDEDDDYGDGVGDDSVREQQSGHQPTLGGVHFS